MKFSRFALAAAVSFALIAGPRALAEETPFPFSSVKGEEVKHEQVPYNDADFDVYKERQVAKRQKNKARLLQIALREYKKGKITPEYEEILKLRRLLEDAGGLSTGEFGGRAVMMTSSRAVPVNTLFRKRLLPVYEELVGIKAVESDAPAASKAQD